MFSTKVFVKRLQSSHLLSSGCVHLNQNNDFLGIFPFHSNNCQKMSNVKTGTDSVNPCIKQIAVFISVKVIKFMLVLNSVEKASASCNHYEKSR